MALPTLLALEDCADYSKTVEPFLPQLYSLPEKLLDVVARRQSLSSLYIETNPLVSGFAFSIFLGAVFLVASEINRNYSQVDRFWSLLPTFYIAHFDLWARMGARSSKPTQRERSRRQIRSEMAHLAGRAQILQPTQSCG